MHTITSEEHDTIMAGLRLLQEHIVNGDVSEDIEDVATNAGIHPVLTADQIDELCMTINTEGYQMG